MIFEPVKLGTWKGQEYTIPAEEVVRCIAKVEQAVSIFDLMAMRASGRLRPMQLCQGLGAALRHAGAAVTDEELYDELFKGRERAKDFVLRAWALLSSLEEMMIPPEHLRAEPKSGKGERGKRAASSRSASSSSAGKAG